MKGNLDEGMEGVKGERHKYRKGCTLLHESASSHLLAADSMLQIIFLSLPTTFLHKPAYSCAWECSGCKISLSLCHQVQMQATSTVLPSMACGPDEDRPAWSSPQAWIVDCRAGHASGQELGGRVWDTVHEGVVQVALIALGIESGAVILVEGGTLPPPPG